MKIGVPKEIKQDERRVSLTPAGALELCERGHQVLIERGAGAGSGFADGAYADQGAQLLDNATAVFAEADLIAKVKEPQPDEVARLRPGQILFTFLHLAPDPELTELLMGSGATCIAYETIEDGLGGLPLLAPMSEVAGKIATQAGASMLEASQGGRGVLLGGVPGVRKGNVLVIGGGVVGRNAAQIAVGLGAEVVIIDRDAARLRELDDFFDGRVTTLMASKLTLENALTEADLVIGAVLIPGSRAPRVVGRGDLRRMKRGAVLVDVSVDQGGCFETTRATTHSDPTYEVDGITHYCVANMPGAVPITSTWALTNVTMPYLMRLADAGIAAVADDPGFLCGLNVAAGEVTYAPVARDQGWAMTAPASAVSSLLETTSAAA